MLVTELGISVDRQPVISALSLVLMMALQSSRESICELLDAPTILAIDEHTLKGLPLMLSTFLPIVIEVNAVQSKNTPSSIPVTEHGISL